MPPNGAPLSRDQMKPVKCECGCTIFNMIPRALFFRDRLAPKAPPTQVAAAGYTCAQCAKELDLNARPMLEND